MKHLPFIMHEKSNIVGFAERLKHLRQNKNLSQTELAETVGLRYAHIGRYERGLSQPSAQMLSRLADVLDVSADYLLNGNEEDAAVADLKDKELVAIFKEVDACSDEEKEFIKKVLKINGFLDIRVILPFHNINHQLLIGRKNKQH